MGIEQNKKDSFSETNQRKRFARALPRVEIEQEINLSPLARSILQKRYLRSKENGVRETPKEMFWRVAKHVGQVEKHYGCDPNKWSERFYEMMVKLEFLPNSPCLMNAGTQLGQLAACFVLPIEDNLDAIFSAVREAALVTKSGGGTGFSFSHIRPEGDIVGSTDGVASGPISFMRVFDAATNEVKQGGRRRGANMGVLDVTHPDILSFIGAKSQPGILENFNLSVAMDSGFMCKALAGEDYELVNPRTGKVAGRLNAGDVLHKIACEAWKTGEPGLLFLDAVNRANPTPHIDRIEATNPCGEQPLLAYEACNLGSINLTKMVSNEGVDWAKLRQTAAQAVRFLDNVIDASKYPLLQSEEISKGNRKIGLGVMGFANMLYMLGIPYDSEEAVELAEKLMYEISVTAKKKSENLAEEKGVFPNFGGSIYDVPGSKEIRNAARTTIAPTGSISLIAGCSSGIEPNFSLVYERKVEDERVIIGNPVFEQVTRQQGFYRESLMAEILREGSVQKIEGIPEEIKPVFVTALDIAAEWHVRIQAAFQKHTDNAVSKTINLPRTSSVEDVRKALVMAWKLGCKGITIYRDGSRAGQILRTGRSVLTTNMPRERPERTTGSTKKVKVGCGNLYITVNRDQFGVCEVFCVVGRAGGCPAQAESMSRLASIALRSGVSPEAIIEQLRGIRCLSTVTARRKQNGIEFLSCPDAVGSTIEEFISGEIDYLETLFPEKCPECGSRLEQEGGRCVICRSCGFSRCF